MIWCKYSVSLLSCYNNDKSFINVTKYLPIFILQKFCKTSLSNNAIYSPKVSITLALFTWPFSMMFLWEMYMGKKASPPNIVTSIKSTWVYWALWCSPKQISLMHGCFVKANSVLIFEGPNLHLCFSNGCLHLWASAPEGVWRPKDSPEEV